MSLISRSIPLLVSVVGLGASGLTGCASLSNKEKGAIIGATTGAAAGGLIGRSNGSTTRGAIIGHQMDQQAKEIDQNVAGATVERVGEGIHVTFASGLLYDFNSDVVKPTAQTNLRELAKSLSKYPNSNLLIAGHTDSVGTDAYNQQLSERRAAAAAAYLVSQGVDRARIITRGLGEAEPVEPNTTEAGRQQNRRVEVAIYANEELRQSAAQQAGTR